MTHDISVARARAASGIKPPGPHAGGPVSVEQDAAVRSLQEQTKRLREARLRQGRGNPDADDANATIGRALRAAAAYVDDNGSGTAWDPHQRLTDVQRFAKGEKIRAVAHELRGLADASETRRPRYGEYEALMDRLYAFGLSLTVKLTQEVVTAFHEAGDVTRSQEKA